MTTSASLADILSGSLIPAESEGGVASRFGTMLSRFYHFMLKHALKFGVIGLIGYLIDVGVFNLLRLGVIGEGTVLQQPITAKIVSVSIATLVTWFGNRYWTFRERRRHNFMLELLEFSAIAAVGLGIGVLCLWISHYLLGFDNLVADNISSNIIGVALATMFRFLMYRFWVYGSRRKGGLADRQAAAAESEMAKAS